MWCVLTCKSMFHMLNAYQLHFILWVHVHIHDIDGLNNLGVNHILVETLVNWWTLIENTVISNMIRCVCVTYGSYETDCVSECIHICIIIFILYSFEGRDPYCTDGWGKMGYCYIYVIQFWKKGPVLHGWMGEDGVLLYLYYMLLEERTRIAQVECEDDVAIHI